MVVGHGTLVILYIPNQVLDVYAIFIGKMPKGINIDRHGLETLRTI
jgi:hypothetical protein